MAIENLVKEFERIKLDLNNCENLTGKKKETIKIKLLAKETDFIENLVINNQLEVIEHFIRQNLETESQGFDLEHVLHTVFSSDTIDPKDFLVKWINKYSMDDYQMEQFIKICDEYSNTECVNAIRILNIKLSLNFLYQEYEKLNQEFSPEEVKELQTIIKESDFSKLFETRKKQTKK